VARREYRSPTGKLRGYSQTDTERTGGKAGVVSLLVFMGGAAIWQYFSGPSPSSTPPPEQQATIAGPQSSEGIGQTTAQQRIRSSDLLTGENTSPDPSHPVPNKSFVYLAKSTSLYHIESGNITALMELPVGTSVHLLGKYGNGWEHVELDNTSEGKPIEGYIPSWSLTQNE
jgi:hypothetical protein